MVVSYSKWDKVGDEEADEEAREGTMDPGATFDSLTPTPGLGCIVELVELENAKYRGSYGAVISGVMRNARVIVQLENAPFRGKVLQLKPLKLCVCPLEPAVEGLLDGRAVQIADHLWVGDALAGGVARGFLRDTRLDDEIAKHRWPDLIKVVVCCAAEFCGPEAAHQEDYGAKPQNELPLREERKVHNLKDWPLTYTRQRLDKGHAVLVYCADGKSRSVALVLAVLVLGGKTLEEAWVLVKKKIPKPRLNLGLAVALLQQEDTLRGSLSMDLEDLLSKPLKDDDVAEFERKADPETGSFLRTLLPGFSSAPNRLRSIMRRKKQDGEKEEEEGRQKEEALPSQQTP